MKVLSVWVELVLVLLLVAMVLAVQIFKLDALVLLCFLVEARENRLLVHIMPALSDCVSQRLVVELLFYEGVQGHWVVGWTYYHIGYNLVVGNAVCPYLKI